MYRYPGVSNHKFLFPLLLKIMEKYQSRNETEKLVLDFFKLNVEGLLDIINESEDDQYAQIEFRNSLEQFLNKNLTIHFNVVELLVREIIIILTALLQQYSHRKCLLGKTKHLV